MTKIKVTIKVSFFKKKKKKFRAANDGGCLYKNWKGQSELLKKTWQTCCGGDVAILRVTSCHEDTKKKHLQFHSGSLFRWQWIRWCWRTAVLLCLYHGTHAGKDHQTTWIHISTSSSCGGIRLPGRRWGKICNSEVGHWIKMITTFKATEKIYEMNED